MNSLTLSLLCFIFYILLYMYWYQTLCYGKKSILETHIGLVVPDRDTYSLITMQGLFTILYPISPHYILSMMKCHFLKALELKHCCASKRKSAVSSVKHPHARWDFSIHCTMGNEREELQFPHNYTIIFHCFQNSQFHFQFTEAYEIISKYYNRFYGHFSKFYEM